MDAVEEIEIRLRSGLNPFDPSNKKYFLDRNKRSITKERTGTHSRCPGG